MTGPVSARLGPEKRVSTGWPGLIYHDIPGAEAGALFAQSVKVQAVAGSNCFTFGSRLMIGRHGRAYSGIMLRLFFFVYFSFQSL